MLASSSYSGQGKFRPLFSRRDGRSPPSNSVLRPIYFHMSTKKKLRKEGRNRPDYIQSRAIMALDPV